MPSKTTVISIVSSKGGVGKTTIAANTSGLLAALNLRVLEIDADPQPSLTRYYEITENAPAGLSDVLYRGGEITAQHISRTNLPNLSIIRSDMLDGDGHSVPVESWLATRVDGVFMLKRAMKSAFVQENFDVVVIDSPGKSGPLASLAAMAGDFMVAPFRPDILSMDAFRSELVPMIASLNRLRDTSPELGTGPVKILLNDVARTRNAREFAKGMRMAYRPDGNVNAHPDISILDTAIPRSAAVSEATSYQTPIHELDTPKKTKSLSGYEVMHRLVFELMPHLKDVWVADAIEETFSSDQGDAA